MLHHLRGWPIDEHKHPEQLLGNFGVVMCDDTHILHHVRVWSIDDDEQPEQLLGNFVVMCDDTYCII